MRLPYWTWYDEVFMGCLLFFLALAVFAGCGAQNREAGIRGVATWKVSNCRRHDTMTEFWCREEAQEYCKAQGLEPTCWDFPSGMGVSP